MTAWRRRLAVTGLGAVSPAGESVAATWQRLLRGPSCAAPIAAFDAREYPTTFACEVPGFEPEAGLDRVSGLALVAAGEALGAAGAAGRDEACGLVLAAGQAFYGHEEIFAPVVAAARDDGGFDAGRMAAELARVARPRLAERLGPVGVAQLLAERHRLEGPVSTVDTACAAGAQAVVDAARWLRMGLVDRVLVGAADSQITPLGLASFSLLGTLSKRNEDPAAASRPFDRDRDGFVLGEGAAFLVIETEESARRRGARVHAWLAGGASACDAYRVTDPHPEGRGALAAMRGALAAAGLAPPDLGYVNAHGTSTRRNDPIESAAIAELCGGVETAPPTSSTKSVTGHLTVAAGALEAIATVLALREQTLPPTMNLQVADPGCRLDVVPNRPRAATLEHALSNSFGFGGQCTALVFSRCDDA